MKRIPHTLLLASLLLNIYCAAAWGFVCYVHAGAAERSKYYSQFVPCYDPRTFSIVALCLTLLSLIVFIADVRRLRGWYIIIVVAQVLFALHDVWQLL